VRVNLPDSADGIIYHLEKYIGKHVETHCRVPDWVRTGKDRRPEDEDWGGDCGILQGVYLEVVGDGGDGHEYPMVESDWGMDWAVFPEDAWIEVLVDEREDN